MSKSELESMFSSLVKKDIAAATKFIKFANNVVADERCRREKLTDNLHLKIVSNKRVGVYYHIARDIFDETRHLANASNSEDVLTCLKEITKHMFRLVTINNDATTGDLPCEFQVLFDMGANCADFLSEEERRDITQSIKEYVTNKWHAL